MCVEALLKHLQIENTTQKYEEEEQNFMLEINFF